MHSAAGHHLGYVVVDRARPAASWGALLAMRHLSVDDACLLARATTLQLGLLSVPRGSSHFLLTGGGDIQETERSAFLESLRPLTDRELCRIVLEDGPAGPSPPIARKGLLASAVAATTAALDLAARRVHGATVALHMATPLAHEVARALAKQGLRVLGEGATGLLAGADVVLVGAPLWALGAREASLVRAPVLVSLGTTRSSLMAEEVLHERRVLFVPEAVAAGGRLLALHLSEKGANEAEALALTRALTSERLTEVFTRFLDRPLADGVRAYVDTAAERAA